MSNSTLDILEDFLVKARNRLSDENPDYADQDEAPDNEGLDDWGEGDLQGEEDPADAYLRENDPDYSAKEPKQEEVDDELDDYEKPAKKPVASAAPAVRRRSAPANQSSAASEPKQAPAPVVTKPALPSAVQPGQAPRESKRVVMPSPTSASADPRESSDMQPTREELMQLRGYTRAYSSRARDKARLEADASKNPVRHHDGRLVEARNMSHADYQQAYNEFARSPEFQNADPFDQMDMETQFKTDWKNGNPDHHINALKAHAEAYKKGEQAKGLFAQAKDEKIRHIAGGGVNPDAFSIEEGLQHAGGSREEDEKSPGGISQDKSAAFASGNREFVDQYMQNYNKKARKPGAAVDEYAAADEQRPDVASVIGAAPQFENSGHKRAHDMLVQKYYPLIERAARRTLGKMGLTQAADSGQLDDTALHEAGVNALYQAIGDYDHDHPSKASFVTHLNRKMGGLMQTALKTQDEIPAELRAGATKFKQATRDVTAAPVKHTNKEGVTTVINPGGAKPAATPPAAAAPSAPPPAAAPVVAKPPMKRSVTDIAAGKHSDIQDRVKRLAAFKPKRDINYVAPEED